MKTLEILIPTYQRVSFLLQTLRFLSAEIRTLDEARRPSLLIADNGSRDDTAEALKDFVRANPDIKMRLILKPHNEGMEANFATIFKEASADYVICTSDDDLLAEGYLDYLTRLIQTEDAPGVVVPGIIGVRPDGSTDGSPRQFAFDTKSLPAGPINARYLSHFLTQMSGLVFRNDAELVDRYMASPWRNVYPFVFLGTALALRDGSVLAPKFRTRVLDENSKAWNYPPDGYTDMVLKNFRMLELSLLARTRYEIEFLRYQKFRLQGIRREPIMKRIKMAMGLQSPSPLTKGYIIYNLLQRK
jgi:glycosyltransferase involved in cell wall biosynthesis